MRRPTLTLLVALGGASPVLAQDVPVSTCLAIADRLPGVRYASLDAPQGPVRMAQNGRGEVKITYVHHATYMIESARACASPPTIPAITAGEPPDV